MPERPNTMPPIMSFEYDPTNSTLIIHGRRLQEINQGIENDHEAAQLAAWCFVNCAAVNETIRTIRDGEKICVICRDNKGDGKRTFMAVSGTEPDEIFKAIWENKGIQEAVQCPYSSTYPTDTEK